MASKTRSNFFEAVLDIILTLFPSCFLTGSLTSLFDSDAARVLGGLCRLKIVESQQGMVSSLGPSHWLALWQLAPLDYFELSAPGAQRLGAK